MNFDELIDFLEKRLRMEMPGAEAHNLMQPKMPNGEPIPMKHAKSPRKGGVLILLYSENGRAHFPLIQRPRYEGIHSGQMALPGGRFEKEDKNQFQTALRETEEEIGVDMNKVEVIGNLSEFFVAASNYMVLPVIGKIDFKPNFIPEPKEVYDIVTPPIGHLIDPSRLKEKEMIVRNGFRLQCPYYDLEGRTVWGATAMMLSELVVLLQEFKQQ